MKNYLIYFTLVAILLGGCSDKRISKSQYPQLNDAELSDLQSLQDSFKVAAITLTKPNNFWQYNLEESVEKKLNTEKSLIITLTDAKHPMFRNLSIGNKELQQLLSKLFMELVIDWGSFQYDLVEIKAVNTNLIGNPQSVVSRTYVKKDCKDTDHYCPEHYVIHTLSLSESGVNTVYNESPPINILREIDLKVNEGIATDDGLYIKYADKNSYFYPQTKEIPSTIAILESPDVF
jgi:hypothetical protein